MTNNVWHMRRSFIYKVNSNRIAVIEDLNKQYWNFPDHIAHISTCNDKQYPDIAFVLTQDGTLWKIESLAAVEYVNSERPTKRIKRSSSSEVQDGEIRFVTQNQIISRKRTSTAWIQAYTRDGTVGCLIYQIDGSLCFCSIDGSEHSITQRVSVDTNFITRDDVVVQTYLPGGSLSGVLHQQEKQIDAVLFGTKKGKLYYKAIDETLEVCILDHPETMLSLHLCPDLQIEKSSSDSGNELKDSETTTAIAVMSHQGTLTLLYAFDDVATLQVKELSLSCPVIASVTFKNALYTLSAENAIHRILLDPTSAHMELNESLVCDVHNKQQLVAIALIQSWSSADEHDHRLVGISKDHTITELELAERMMEPTDVNTLQARIQETLAEIEQCQQDEASLDNLNTLYNNKITEYNSTIYKLQRMSKVTADNNASSLEAQPSIFSCDMFPKILDDSLRSLIATETLVHVQLRTDMSLKWKHWRVNIDIDPSDNTANESSSQAICGKHFSCSLEKMEVVSQWERDIPIDMNELGLPVYVNLNLAYAPFSDSLTEFNYSMPEIPAIFYCKQVLFDVIHYALPCERIMRAKFETRGLKEITGEARINGWPNRSSSYDACLKKTINARVPKSFRLHVKSDISIDSGINSSRILKNLLEEGLDSALLNGICIKHNKAMFTIPIHRAIPVLITVDKDNTEQNQNYSILVECHQPFILLKVIQALYMRLSFMCDRKEVFSDGHNNLNDEIHQLEKMFKKETDVSDEISKAFDRLSEACNSMTLELVD